MRWSVGASLWPRGGWDDARADFEQALAVSETAEAWDGLSWACWWLEDGPAAIEARECVPPLPGHGDRPGAARMAIWLANDHQESRCAAAVAQGWVRRAARILAGLELVREHGWLAALEAEMACAEGDAAAAERLGARAQEVGRQLDVTDIEMLGLATEGLALVTRGSGRQGHVLPRRSHGRRSRRRVRGAGRSRLDVLLPHRCVRTGFRWIATLCGGGFVTGPTTAPAARPATSPSPPRRSKR